MFAESEHGVQGRASDWAASRRQRPVDIFQGPARFQGTLRGMSFRDLPKDWATRPVTDPAIFTDVVDLIVTDTDRLEGAIYVIICGPTRRIIQPCAVTDLVSAPMPDRRSLFEPFVHALAGGAGGLVVAIARPGRAGVIDSDRTWHQAAVDACAAGGIHLFAVAVATPQGVCRLPEHRRPHRVAS